MIPHPWDVNEMAMKNRTANSVNQDLLPLLITQSAQSNAHMNGMWGKKLRQTDTPPVFGGPFLQGNYLAEYYLICLLGNPSS